MRHKASSLKLTKVHVLPSERACMLIERTFGDGSAISRAELLDTVLAEIGWDDELILVRPLRIWVDRILSLLCSGGHIRRIHSEGGMSYQTTNTWAKAGAVLDSFRHPSPHKQSRPAPVARRRRLGQCPADHVINMREWAEVRSRRADSFGRH